MLTLYLNFGNPNVCTDGILDVESFLLKTLQNERLSEVACNEKDALLNKLKAIQEEHPQLGRFEFDLIKEREKTTTSSKDSPRQQTKQTIYSDESEGE